MVIDSSSQFVIQAAQDVVGQSDSPSERLALLFAFVRDRITYSFSAASMFSSSNPAEVFRASGTIKRGYGMCIQKAVLLCALARASGFRARLSFQALRDHRLPRELVALIGSDVLIPHGLVSVECGGRWLRLDASLDASLCVRKGYRLTAFSEVEDALLPTTDAQGRPHFEIIEELGDFDDFPLEFVVTTLAQRYAGADAEALTNYVRRTGATM